MTTKALRGVLAAGCATLALAGCQSLGRKPAPAPQVGAESLPAPPLHKRAATRPAASALVLRSCVPQNLPVSPAYPDTDAALRASAGAADRYQLLAAGRLLRQQRLSDLERIIERCR